MKYKLLIMITAVCLGASFNALAKQNGGKHLVLNLIGTGNMYEGLVPDIDGDNIDDPAICF